MSTFHPSGNQPSSAEQRPHDGRRCIHLSWWNHSFCNLCSGHLQLDDCCSRISECGTNACIKSFVIEHITHLQVLHGVAEMCPIGFSPHHVTLSILQEHIILQLSHHQ